MSAGEYLVRIEISEKGATRVFDMPSNAGRNAFLISEDAVATIDQAFFTYPIK